MITEKDARPPLSGAGPEEVVNRYQYNDSSFLNTLLKAWPDVKAEAPPPRGRALVVVAVKINARTYPLPAGFIAPNNREGVNSLVMHYELKAWPNVQS